MTKPIIVVKISVNYCTYIIQVKGFLMKSLPTWPYLISKLSVTYLSLVQKAMYPYIRRAMNMNHAHGSQYAKLMREYDVTFE